MTLYLDDLREVDACERWTLLFSYHFPDGMELNFENCLLMLRFKPSVRYLERLFPWFDFENYMDNKVSDIEVVEKFLRLLDYKELAPEHQYV